MANVRSQIDLNKRADDWLSMFKDDEGRLIGFGHSADESFIISSDRFQILDAAAFATPPNWFSEVDGRCLYRGFRLEVEWDIEMSAKFEVAKRQAEQSTERRRLLGRLRERMGGAGHDDDFLKLWLDDLRTVGRLLQEHFEESGFVMATRISKSKEDLGYDAMNRSDRPNYWF